MSVLRSSSLCPMLLLACVSASWATSCKRDVSLSADPGASDLLAQAREVLGRNELVGTGEILSLREAPKDSLSNAGLARIYLLRYFRKPLDAQADETFEVIVPVDLKPGMQVLVMAARETADAYRARQSGLSDTDPIWPKGVWHGAGQCWRGVRALEELSSARLLSALEAIDAQADEPQAAGKLFLGVDLNIDPVPPIDESAHLQTIDRKTNAVVRETSVRLGPAGKEPLELPAGLYRIKWPRIHGFDLRCGPDDADSPCATFELPAGSEMDLTAVYVGTAGVRIDMADSSGPLENLLADVRLLRQAQPNDAAWLPSDWQVRPNFIYHLPPGRYRAELAISEVTAARWSCNVVSTRRHPMSLNKLPQFDLGAGEHELTLQMPPTVPIARLVLSARSNPAAYLSVQTVCVAGFMNQSSVGGRDAIEASSPIGQALSLQISCTDPKCRPSGSGQRLLKVSKSESIELMVEAPN